MNKVQHLEQANVVENDEKCHDKEKCFCNNYVAKNSYSREDCSTCRVCGETMPSGRSLSIAKVAKKQQKERDFMMDRKKL